jgi:glycerol uptake facilitator-like aquaporin
MQVTLRLYLTELLGTFLVVLFGAGTVCAYYLLDPPHLEIAGIALAEGFMLGVLLATFGPLGSAGFNPAITLALYIRQKFDLRTTAYLIGTQFLGALLAGLVLRLWFSEAVALAAHLGTPHLTEAFRVGTQVTVPSLTSGALFELLCTAVLSFAFCWWMLDPDSPKLAGLLVGLVQVAIILFGFRLTGGSANPARWFGPAVWEATLPGHGNVFDDHAVYWAGPIAGAILGAIVAGMLHPVPGDKGR